MDNLCFPSYEMHIPTGNSSNKRQQRQTHCTMKVITVQKGDR